MRKVLVIITTGFETCGGLASVMLNYYRVMDKTDLQIDFASVNELDADLKDELIQCNSQYYNLGSRKSNIFLYVKNLCKVLKDNNYHVIHVNGNSSTMLIELLIALKYKIKKRIAHVHTTKSDYPLIHNILKPIFKKSYTDAIAVSDLAGKWLFDEHFQVLNNAIDVQHYSYNELVRSQFRKRYQLENKLVIGNVGKLTDSKNHIFLLNVFKRIKERITNSVLLIVGGGSLEESLRLEAKKLEIEESVIFLGMQNDTSESLQAMDVFVFPSKFEGLGMALIEAQASGLPCVVSNRVPKEANVTENVIYLELENNMEKWIENICTIDIDGRKFRAEKAEKVIATNGYDIKHEANKLKDIYENEE